MLVPHDKPIALIILDGWGLSASDEGNAIAAANTPNFDKIMASFPNVTLEAAGEAVGLAKGSSGNAEVGHLSIGTGRAAHSDVFQIEQAIRSGEFARNDAILTAINAARENGKALHLIGMLSDAGVHSSMNSLYELLRMAKNAGLRDVFIHAILDGVDVSTRTADIYVEALEIKLADIGIGRVATLCGRYFAMDSGGNWERTARAFTMLVHGEGERTTDAMTAIRNSFLRGISDEFVSPVVLESEPDVPVARISDGDSVIFFNHRPEATRQLVRSLAVPDAAALGKPDVNAVCLTEYDAAFALPVAFHSRSNSNVLIEALADAGIPNFKITQNERFPHLTYFFNGGDEIQHVSEQQILVPVSPTSTIESHPESQSFRLADKAMRMMEANGGGLFVINLPAAGLAAEAGSYARSIEAAQFVDVCLGGIVEKVHELGGVSVVTSSHGNCEAVSDRESGSAKRMGTENEVPFSIVSTDLNCMALRSNGTLADVAPTLLSLYGIRIPTEMTGQSLIVQ